MDETGKTKFCKFCGAKIPEDAVLCSVCGRQVEEIKQSSSTPQVVVNNTNSNAGVNPNANGVVGRKLCNKWVSFVLCLFLGFFGAHKFYEGNAGMGVLYMFTGGLFLIGYIVDLITILGRPNPYLA